MRKRPELIYEGEDSLIYLEENEGKKYIRKMLRDEEPQPDQLLRFNNEYAYTHDIEVEGIRKAIRLEQKNRYHAILLEYVKGLPLEDAFAKDKADIGELLEAFIKIAEILGHLHESGIVHKDINARNILWEQEAGKPVIIDLGISDRFSLVIDDLRSPDKIKGTLQYISPEQTGRVNRVIDCRSDLYSLGVTMYRLFTGKFPFEFTDPLELVHAHIARVVPMAHLYKPGLPEMISRIIVKLMAKNAEDRYQSAFGLKYDLERCLEQWRRNNQVDEFELGEQDFSGQFRLPQKLYGRQEEVQQLLSAYERISRGSTEMVLVAGYSGVGKSALVKEIYKPVTEKRGYFVSGKFDQYRRNTPYSAIIQAFTEFCDLLLTEKKERLDSWVKAIKESIGESGQVLIDVIPAIEKIIGPQPPVPRLETQEALNRFNIVFFKFIKGISKAEHPFTLFCDDLQWADVSSINLLKLLISDMQNPYMLVIGAYRDNEVAAGHPLLNMIDAAIKDKAVINTINLKPLREEDLYELIKDALHVREDAIRDLTTIVFAKTQGNAFFTIEFLKSLNKVGLLRYNFEKRKWKIDFREIRQKEMTNNVIDLLIAKISELPAELQDIIKLASCIGNLFSLRLLANISGKTSREVLQMLWAAVEQNLLQPVGEEYQYIGVIENHEQAEAAFKFSHDRVQQAAYSLLEKAQRQEIHLHIAKFLSEEAANKEERLFDIVNHYDESLELINDNEEKKQLARLNLKASEMAKNASAYSSAESYINIARQLVDDNIWEQDHQLAFDIFTASADIAYLRSDFASSEKYISLCLEKAQTAAEKSAIYFMLMQNYSNAGRYYDAIAAARKGLKQFDFNFPEKEEAGELIPQEMGKVLQYFNENGVEQIAAMAPMKDAKLLAIMNLLDNLSPNTYVAGETNLWILHVLYKVNLTIANGITPQGGYAFNELGIIFFILNNYQFAYPAAFTGMKITECFKQESPRHYCRAGHLHINYNLPWVKHISETIKLNPYYYQISMECGELIFAGYMSMYHFYCAYYLGKDSLSDLLKTIPQGIEFTGKIHHVLAHHAEKALYLAMANLNGQTSAPDNFDAPDLTEAEYLSDCHQLNDNYGIGMILLAKSYALFLQGQYEKALKIFRETQNYAAVLAGSATQDSLYRSGYALTLLQLMDSAAPESDYWQELQPLVDQINIWAENNPANFENKQLLIKAEIARLKGEVKEAVINYNAALQSAEKYEFKRDVALVHLFTGAFWLQLELPIYAQIHLQKAKVIFENLCYERVAQALDEKYSKLFVNYSRRTSSGGEQPSLHFSQHSTTFADLDIQSIFKASHALSEEIVLDKLLVKMLKIVIENVGGQRAVLLLQQFGKWKIEAELDVNEDHAAIHQSKEISAADNLPVSVINYVTRTRTEVISGDSAFQNIFDRDDYLNSRQPGSYLCVPLIYKGEMNAILYVEHKDNINAFTPEKLGVLRLLVSQMSVSLENANLYDKQFAFNQAYQRFVPHDFINALRKDSILQVKLGDHIEEDMTVMFCDIRSYTAISESLNTKDNFQLINDYLRLVGPVIRQNNGFINHYLGDGLIALFKENPENALNAAIQMNNALVAFNEKRIAEDNIPVAIGIGLHTGHVMMGIIGDDERHDANVISDAVNVASRLEGLTRLFGANIILSEKTMNMIGHRELYQFRFLGRLRVKGKKDVIYVYEAFNTDEEKVKVQKQLTLDLFNVAMKDYFNKKFAEAAVSLKKVLEANPDDKTARRYLQNAARYLVENTPEDWDGVEQISEKG